MGKKVLIPRAQETRCLQFWAKRRPTTGSYRNTFPFFLKTCFYITSFFVYCIVFIALSKYSAYRAGERNLLRCDLFLLSLTDRFLVMLVQTLSRLIACKVLAKQCLVSLLLCRLST